jgi:hypothetical protein
LLGPILTALFAISAWKSSAEITLTRVALFVSLLEVSALIWLIASAWVDR